MPVQRPQYSRCSIGRSFLSAAQARGFAMLSPRETVWFYVVGLLTAAVLVWTPSATTPPEPVRLPVGTAESRELASGARAERPEMVRGPTGEATTGGAAPLVMNSRRAIPHSRLVQTSRRRQKAVGRSTIFDVRAAGGQTVDAAPQSRGNEGNRAPRPRADESSSPAPRPGDSPTRKTGNPRRRP
jgi:hypothetical protein